MADEEIKILVEEELEPVNILIEELGHGVTASIFDHKDVEKIGSLQESQSLVYDPTKQKFVNKLISGVLVLDEEYECFIVP